MKRVLISLLLTIVLVLAPIGVMSAINNEPPPAASAASAEPVINCSSIRINRNEVRITCSAAGIQLLNTVVQLPNVNITVPGPTITVKIPGQDETITVPGPTKTVQLPGDTSTVTIAPPPDTASSRPQDGPTATVTEERTVSTTETITRQEPSDDGTLDTGTGDGGITLPEVDLSKPEAVGLGLFSIGLIVALIVLGLWSGYYLGYKDRDKAEANFLKSLIQRKG